MKKNNNSTVKIQVSKLARVEGEGALKIDIHKGKIESLQLNIYEPPRLFEKFLEGRDYYDVIEFVARICGICPIAYQMSAVHAIERIFGIDPGPWVREMRRLFYCGEWVESHALHVHLLAVPDFLGYNSAIAMAKDHPEEVKRGMRLQNLGNDIIRLLGMRSVHPVGARVGGFHHAPRLDAVNALLEKLDAGLQDAEALLRWAVTLPLPDITQEFTCVSIGHPDEYPMNEGNIVSNDGLDIPIENFHDHFQEHHVEHSTALHCLLHDKPYMVGPLARVNLHHRLLPEPLQRLMTELGLKWPQYNMFYSVVARAVEIYNCLYEAKWILQNYRYPDSPFVDVKTKAGVGYGCTEAPRGMIWHRYELDADGLVKSATIVPPTSQNQARIEEDVKFTLESFGLHHDKESLRQKSEMAIRNYDPCISCSVHFLDLQVNRR